MAVSPETANDSPRASYSLDAGSLRATVGLVGHLDERSTYTYAVPVYESVPNDPITAEFPETPTPRPNRSDLLLVAGFLRLASRVPIGSVVCFCPPLTLTAAAGSDAAIPKSNPRTLKQPLTLARCIAPLPSYEGRVTRPLPLLL